MIRAMLNLRCTHGHRFYAPNPAHWERRLCGRSSGMVRCEGKLHAEEKAYDQDTERLHRESE